MGSHFMENYMVCYFQLIYFKDNTVHKKNAKNQMETVCGFFETSVLSMDDSSIRVNEYIAVDHKDSLIVMKKDIRMLFMVSLVTEVIMTNKRMYDLV